MEIIEVMPNSKYIDKIEEIYLYSFPKQERIEFNEVVNCKFPNSKILGFVENDNLIGFSFVSVLNNFTYIVYLSIDKDLRNNGYGTKALKKLDDVFKDNTKMLCVEKPKSKQDIASRRIEFYKRNNFALADFEFECWGQEYYVMYCGKFNKEKIIEFLLTCFPDSENFKDIW